MKARKQNLTIADLIDATTDQENSAAPSAQPLFEVPAPVPVNPPRLAAIDPNKDVDDIKDRHQNSPGLELTGWANAPEYDTEHPGELSYRPFPIEPFLTENPSVDDPVLARLVHPDLYGARELVGSSVTAVPLRFKPGLQYAEMLWSDMFTGGSVNAMLKSDPALRPWAQQTRVYRQ